MPSAPFRVTQTGVSTTAGFTNVFFPDYYVRPFNIGLGCVVNSTTVTYSVQHTFDYLPTILTSGFVSSNATWFNNSGITAATSNQDGNYAYPVTAIRLNVTGGSSTGTVVMTCIQSG